MQKRPTEARVVISSPNDGLEEYRRKAIDAVLRMGMRPIEMDQLVTESSITPLEVSLRLIDNADIYVGIIAFKYGSEPEGETKSFTEFEYQHAKERKIDILYYEMDESYDGLSGNDFERDPKKLKKLTEFKKRLNQELVKPRKFTTPDNFAYELVASLSRLRREVPKRLHGHSPIPLAPKPYIAHPYTLLDARRVIGRQDELGILTDWIAKPDSDFFDIRVLNVVAIGGMGKSALTWKWFKQVVPNELTDLDGSVWWSFYESDASFELFVTRVLAYMTGCDVAVLYDVPIKDRVERLLYQLNEKSYLIVLDGFERLLNAYAKYDAARMEDSDLDRQTQHGVTNPIGEPPETKDEISRHYLRLASDEIVREFLKKLCSIERSKVLITTRLFPADLQEEKNGRSLAGTKVLELKGLKPADAIELWRGFENSGTRENILNLFEKFDYYPLLISAFAGLVRDYRPAPGNFDRWLEENINFDVFGGSRKLVRKRILDFALSGLEPQSDVVLRVLSAFLMPASYDILARLLVGPWRPIKSEQDLHDVLVDLEDRGLVGWDRSSNRYDLHPVVRGMTWARLPKELRRDAHLALQEFFSMLPDPLDNEIDTFDDLAGKVQEYDSLLGLGDLDAAATQFENNLQYYTRYRLKAFRQRRELLVAITQRNNRDFNFEDIDREMYCFYRLGETDVVMNRHHDAIPSLYKALAHFTSTGSVLAVSVHYYLGCAFTGMGRFREAINHLYTALTLSRKKYDINTISNQQGFGDILRALSEVTYIIRSEHFEGISKAGLQALSIEKPESSDFYALKTLKHSADGDLKAAQKFADMSNMVAVEQKLGMGEVASALWQGQIALLRNDYEMAEERFAHVISNAKEANLIGDEVSAEIGLARSFLIRGRVEEALDHLKQARSVLLPNSMVLEQVDLLNTAAKIERARKRNQKAVEVAKEAYCLAWCDGPPYTYSEGLDESRAILEELGADLPPPPQTLSSSMYIEQEESNLSERVVALAGKVEELPPGITNSSGLSDAQLREKICKVKEKIDSAKTTGSAKKWWQAFEEENEHRLPLVLRLAEELKIRKATIGEFFLAFIYSNTDNIQANLSYLDYTRLKKEGEEKKQASENEQEEATAQSFFNFTTPETSPQLGFTDTSGWSIDKIYDKIEQVKEKLNWGETSESAEKWWQAFVKENENRLPLVLRLAEELQIREATIDEFFLAYVYSNTDNIQANLHYLDYTRLKKEEEERKQATTKAAAEAERNQANIRAATEHLHTTETPPDKRQTRQSTRISSPRLTGDINLGKFDEESWLMPGISGTHGWSVEDLNEKLTSVSEKIKSDDESASAWWQTLVNENSDRIDLIVRLAEELAKRKSNIQELYHAKQMSESRCIRAILSFLDFFRSGGATKIELAESEVKSIPLTNWVEAFPDVRDEPDFINCPHCLMPIPLASSCRSCKKDLGIGTAQPLLHAATSSPGNVQNSYEWPKEKLNKYILELENAISSNCGEAASWWVNFRTVNTQNPRYLARLLEEVQLRSATLGDLHQAFQYANTNSIVAILHFMDYWRRLEESGSSPNLPEFRQGDG